MITGLSKEQLQMLEALYDGKQNPFTGLELTVTNGGEGLALSSQGGKLTLRLGDSRLLCRGLMLAEAYAQGGDFSISETPAYHDLGVMLDCSRGAVMNQTAFRRFVQILARMGYTVLQLYMEDTFELPGYPYFGYRRGGYSCRQLKEMDSYAAQFGIELVPAVQTLAHMAQMLRWPAFHAYRDVGDILLMEDEQTYALVDAIFKTLSDCFTSRRVNIGMDEAHLLGLGRYLDKHGYKDRMQLMLNHLERVLKLARGHGLQTMLWSDMFFRLATGGDYYATDCVVDQRIAKSIPEDVSLIYWDYYSEDSKVYDRMLEKHKEMCSSIIFAGGAWKWMGFSPNNAFSCKVAQLAHASCSSHGVGEVLLTAWGDNGGECSAFAMLPALQYWAELCYHGGKPEEGLLAARFAASCGGQWKSFMQLDEPMLSPNSPSPGRCAVTPQRYTLYQDILEGIFDAHIQPDRYSAYYAQAAEHMEIAAKQADAEWKPLFETQQALCRVLAYKCRCGLDIRNAYHQGDRRALDTLAESTLPELKERLAGFTASFHRQWLRENHPAGLATFDIRIGGVAQRIDTAIERIRQYLHGEITVIEELEVPLLTYDGQEHRDADLDVPGPFWHLLASHYDMATI